MLLEYAKSTAKIHERGSLKEPLFAAAATSIVGLGDAFLYPILPVYSEQLGYSALWVGVLLSVNRLVRVVGNTFVARLISSYGSKKILLFCSVLAVITTALYGVGLGVWLFLFCRILWGLSYSGFQLGTLNFAAAIKTKKGLAFGLVKSIKSLGQLVVLFLGPVLLERVGLTNSFFIIATGGGMGVLLLCFLPNKTIQYSKEPITFKRTFSVTPINWMVFVFALVVDGVMVVGLAEFLKPDYATTYHLVAAVAAYLLVKRLALVVLSLFVGYFSLFFNPSRMFLAAACLVVGGVLMVLFGWTSLGLVVVFICNSVVVCFAPYIAVQNNPVHPLQPLSAVSTWWDIGAALGALVGVYLLQNLAHFWVLLALFILCFMSLLYYFLETRNKEVVH